MTLERYNQILWATLGTIVFFGAIVLVIWLIAIQNDDGTQPSIVLAKPNEAKPRQDLVFCEPIVIRGAKRQLIPVAVVNKDDPDSEKTVMLPGSGARFKSDYSYSPSNCGFNQYGGSSRIFNVIVRDTQTEQQWLLLNRPAQIESMYVPSERCDKGEGGVPCGFIQWHIRDRDTNKDGVIDNKDALVVFFSDDKATSLNVLTTYGGTLLNSVWDRDRNSILYQLRIDSNGDGKFDKGEGTNIYEYTIGKSNLAEPIVDEKVRKELLSRIN